MKATLQTQWTSPPQSPTGPELELHGSGRGDSPPRLWSPHQTARQPTVENDENRLGSPPRAVPRPHADRAVRSGQRQLTFLTVTKALEAYNARQRRAAAVLSSLASMTAELPDRSGSDKQKKVRGPRPSLPSARHPTRAHGARRRPSGGSVARCRPSCSAPPPSSPL